jgi:hypothetical protein
MSEIDFTAILTRDFPWPKPGDRAFVRANHWEDNAYLERHSHSRTVMMMTGYKKGADLMAARAQEDQADRYALVYPIVFNYRQFLELWLKYLIATYGRTVGVAATWKSHSLSELWNRFIEVLDGYGAREPNGTDELVAATVTEFDKVDPGSFSFRYPVDTKGRGISLLHKELDLAALARVMDGVEGYFTGCDGYLDNLQSAGP